MLDNQTKDLLLRSQAGDKEAYRALLEQLSTYINSSLRRKIGINDNNDDLTQEILLGVHKSLNTYNPSYPVRAWLLGIIRYKLADYFRSIGKEQGQFSLVEDDGIAQEYRGPEEEFGRRLFVQSFLEELSACTKKAIILTKVEGRTIKEASQILGVKEVNLRKQLSRAMKQLVRRFEFYE